MSSVRAAERILDNLLKAKGVSRDTIREINRAESQASRLLMTVTQLARGDVTNLITYLASLGPLGWKIAAIIAAAAVGYMIYREVTKEQPTEMYFWRYPE